MSPDVHRRSNPHHPTRTSHTFLQSHSSRRNHILFENTIIIVFFSETRLRNANGSVSSGISSASTGAPIHSNPPRHITPFYNHNHQKSHLCSFLVHCIPFYNHTFLQSHLMDVRRASIGLRKTSVRLVVTVIVVSKFSLGKRVALARNRTLDSSPRLIFVPFLPLFVSLMADPR